MSNERENDNIDASENNHDIYQEDRITMEDVDFETQLTEENSTINSRYS